MIRRLAVMALLAVLAAGCEVVGVQEGDKYLQQKLATLRVTDVACPDTIAVGETATCDAFNSFNARISMDGVQVVTWSTSLPSAVSVDLTGSIQGRAAGQSVITAAGYQGTQSSDTIVVR